MRWEVRVPGRVQKQVQRFPAKDARRIKAVIKGFKNNPFAGDIERIAGEENIWRRRSGAYRILYELFSKDQIVLIFDIRRRTSTTYK
jgi:mRNA-degrading endonuclease RelE of RelBE toxin-antitoxin system